MMTGAFVLSGKTAVVTGASRGIGLAVARELAVAGADVAVVARSEKGLASVAAEIGGHALRADLSLPEDIASLAERVDALFGGAPDILVNSAGAFSLAPFASTEVEDFDLQLAVNLRGPFLTIRAFLPAMTDRRSGHIVNIGSVAGRLAFPGNAAYSASKFGLRGLHEVLVAELRGSGVRATLVEPSATNTSLWDALDPDNRSDLPSRGAMLRAEDVARAVRFVLEQPSSVEISTLSIGSS